MKTVVLILTIVAAVFAAEEAAPRSPWRIVGGTVTTINQYPFAAALLFSRSMTTYWQSCGGTIINNRAILSAAHCFRNDSPGMWRVRVGSTWANSGGVVHNTQQLIMHPQYDHSTYNNDVAVLRVASNIVFNNVVQPGSIAGPTYIVPDNAAVWAIGWGAVQQGGPSSEQLRHVQVWTVNQNVCSQRYWPSLISENMLCSGWLDVGGRDQCQGDSGGPLLHNNVVVGVCSWGRGCAQAYFPGVNARVSRFTNWILSNA